MNLQDLVDRLREFDLLLDTDQRFPSVTGLVIGDSRGQSWWAHPQAKQSHRLSCALRDHPDVLLVKLISAKLTFIHRPLWPAIFAIATAREPWQMVGLTKEAQALLRKVDEERNVSSSGDPVRELEARLLVRATSVHTQRGFHMKELQSWTAWAKSERLGKANITPAEARAQLESVVSRLNKQFAARGTLPWRGKT
jgi:hypothetical protein